MRTTVSISIHTADDEIGVDTLAGHPNYRLLRFGKYGSGEFTAFLLRNHSETIIRALTDAWTVDDRAAYRAARRVG
jgi:hypothetical protein